MRVIAFILSLSLLGCYTEKKASWQQDKVLKKFPEIAAEKVRLKFPCVDGKTDTVTKVTTKDTTIYVECPDLEIQLAEEYNNTIDSILKSKPTVVTKTKIVKVPVTLPVRTQTVTIKVKDSAQLFVLQDQNNQLVKKVEKTQIVSDRWKLAFIIAAILFVIALLFNILQFKIR